MENKGIASLIVVAIVIVIIVAILSYSNSSDVRTPEETLNLFYDSMNENDSDGIQSSTLNLYGHYQNQTYGLNFTISNITVRYQSEMSDYEKEIKEIEIQFVEDKMDVVVEDFCIIDFTESIEDHGVRDMSFLCVKIDGTWYLGI